MDGAGWWLIANLVTVLASAAVIYAISALFFDNALAPLAGYAAPLVFIWLSWPVTGFLLMRHWKREVGQQVTPWLRQAPI